MDTVVPGCTQYDRGYRCSCSYESSRQWPMTWSPCHRYNLRLLSAELNGRRIVLGAHCKLLGGRGIVLSIGAYCKLLTRRRATDIEPGRQLSATRGVTVSAPPPFDSPHGVDLTVHHSEPDLQSLMPAGAHLTFVCGITCLLLRSFTVLQRLLRPAPRRLSCPQSPR